MMVTNQSYTEGVPIPINELPAYNGSLSKFHTIGYAEVTDEETGETTLQTSKVSLEPIEAFTNEMQQFASDVQQALSDIATNAAVVHTIVVGANDFKSNMVGEDQECQVVEFSAPAALQFGFIGCLLVNGEQQQLTIASEDDEGGSGWALSATKHERNDEEDVAEELSGENNSVSDEEQSDDTQQDRSIARYILKSPEGMVLLSDDIVELRFLVFEGHDNASVPMLIKQKQRLTTRVETIEEHFDYGTQDAQNVSSSITSTSALYFVFSASRELYDGFSAMYADGLKIRNSAIGLIDREHPDSDDADVIQADDDTALSLLSDTVLYVIERWLHEDGTCEYRIYADPYGSFTNSDGVGPGGDPYGVVSSVQAVELCYFLTSDNEPQQMDQANNAVLELMQ